MRNSMKSIKRRVEKLEQMFNMDGSQRCGTRIILFDENCPEQEALPQNIEDWFIYKEQKRNRPIAHSGRTVSIFMASDEVEARLKRSCGNMNESQNEQHKKPD